MAHVFDEDIFIIDCWLDTKEKEDTLKNLISRVKVFNVPIILCGHYAVKPEIQKMVDYFIYDGNNDILLEKDFKEKGYFLESIINYTTEPNSNIDPKLIVGS